MQPKVPSHPAHFSPAAWLSLAFALLLTLGSLGGVLYRLSLPTDGWFVVDVSTSGNEFEYFRNLVGAELSLQRDDVLVGVAGLDLLSGDGEAEMGVLSRPAGWVVGGQAEYTVLRGGQSLTFSVPLVRWRLWISCGLNSSAWLRLSARSVFCSCWRSVFSPFSSAPKSPVPGPCCCFARLTGRPTSPVCCRAGSQFSFIHWHTG